MLLSFFLSSSSSERGRGKEACDVLNIWGLRGGRDGLGIWCRHVYWGLVLGGVTLGVDVTECPMVVVRWGTATLIRKVDSDVWDAMSGRRSDGCSGWVACADCA